MIYQPKSSNLQLLDPLPIGIAVPERVLKTLRESAAEKYREYILAFNKGQHAPSVWCAASVVKTTSAEAWKTTYSPELLPDTLPGRDPHIALARHFAGFSEHQRPPMDANGNYIKGWFRTGSNLETMFRFARWCDGEGRASFAFTIDGRFRATDTNTQRISSESMFGKETSKNLLFGPMVDESELEAGGWCLSRNVAAALAQAMRAAGSKALMEWNILLPKDPLRDLLEVGPSGVEEFLSKVSMDLFSNKELAATEREFNNRIVTASLQPVLSRILSCFYTFVPSRIQYRMTGYDDSGDEFQPVSKKAKAPAVKKTSPEAKAPAVKKTSPEAKAARKKFESELTFELLKSICTRLLSSAHRMVGQGNGSLTKERLTSILRNFDGCDSLIKLSPVYYQSFYEELCVEFGAETIAAIRDEMEDF